MKTIVYKKHVKNDFVLQIKKGRKIMGKMQLVSDGWHDGCTIRSSLVDAVEKWRARHEELLNAFYAEQIYKVEIQ